MRKSHDERRDARFTLNHPAHISQILPIYFIAFCRIVHNRTQGFTLKPTKGTNPFGIPYMYDSAKRYNFEALYGISKGRNPSM